MVAANEPRNKAMAAFWGKCGREVPRPQSKIKTIAGDGSGLVLEDGRRISWAVAKIKARANEFNFGANKAKLIAKLTELKIGLDFVKIIA